MPAILLDKENSCQEQEKTKKNLGTIWFKTEHGPLSRFISVFSTVVELYLNATGTLTVFVPKICCLCPETKSGKEFV